MRKQRELEKNKIQEAIYLSKKEEAKQLLLASGEKVFEVGHLSERTDGEKIIIK